MSCEFKTFYFASFDEFPNPPFELKDMGIEYRKTPDYYFDNNDRNMQGYLFQYTLKGYGMFETNHQVHRIEPGQAFFVKIPDDEKYYCPELTPEDGWQLLYIHFEGTSVAPYFDKIIQKTGKIMKLDPSSRVIQYLLKLQEDLKNGMKIQPFDGSEIVFHFLSLLCRTVAYSQDAYCTKTRLAIEYMESEYASLNGINSLADRLGISWSHFTREFTKETGINPIKYLTNIRLQNAMQLLINTDLSIHEIAIKCGFSCGNYFGKIFKKSRHVSPYQFRIEKRT
ncbi:MAG: DNA-binding protein AraC-type [Herbinix sp.]|jgi:AraC-like DNA-binding protein|nr:DNA-binding protein AraC-type [Herbinix sp.]